MFVSPAYAQGAAADGGNLLMSVLPFILIFVIFYFLLIRPQQKKMKQHREMIQSLERGDRIVTSGGIVGQIIKVTSDSEVEVEIAPGTRVQVMRQTITEVIEKGAPIRSSSKEKGGRGKQSQSRKSEPQDDSSEAETEEQAEETKSDEKQ
ncbi:preprotein translocase subunit YajC [Fodinicurvata sediminis]|uniref:preprotein translocase subunit YajC n=1 Tax=Fodinicurvata sediminis TaxID=1121832 RepID=UPI0003B41CFB|nr:preprotein translocase subunit YajC [Fodinicurvata sediminis]